ncbi:hypothetical protein Bccel_4180 [Pseudobacteroides cellulosolvens ATCC 35603 = DSM 2933]|uniref:Uncharacterized protein n=1 Tax=Pseudobacteroides cellulosolvens ATCC 35603 = DSM 2933 TaxID=398512 RepID=A0A0L6JST3_9FIRM|nr:hypothetical protein Bccel_4180 [Pseudobacteroides cellulosolvens ATCC 35603 = DSM 2933]
MAKKRNIKIISYFLIFMFIVQICSFFASDIYWFSDGANNSKSQSIIADVVNAHILAVGRENRKSSVKISILKIQCLIQKLSCFNFLIQSLTYKVFLIDKRKEIACIMSNCFHSSKYKSFIAYDFVLFNIRKGKVFHVLNH